MQAVLVDAVGTLVVKNDSGSYEVNGQLLGLLEGIPLRKIILTGANDEQLRLFGLDHAPYEVFTLKHDPEKSDPAYYRTMLETYGFSSDEVVYVEHGQAAVESARAVGIKTFHWNAGKAPLNELREFLAEM